MTRNGLPTVWAVLARMMGKSDLMAGPYNSGASDDSDPFSFLKLTPRPDECGDVIFVAGAGRYSRWASRLGFCQPRP
jgi:hypothetical protein